MSKKDGLNDADSQGYFKIENSKGYLERDAGCQGDRSLNHASGEKRWSIDGH